jgi:hypothetical protein
MCMLCEWVLCMRRVVGSVKLEGLVVSVNYGTHTRTNRYKHTDTEADTRTSCLIIHKHTQAYKTRTHTHAPRAWVAHTRYNSFLTQSWSAHTCNSTLYSCDCLCMLELVGEKKGVKSGGISCTHEYITLHYITIHYITHNIAYPLSVRDTPCIA